MKHYNFLRKVKGDHNAILRSMCFNEKNKCFDIFQSTLKLKLLFWCQIDRNEMTKKPNIELF